MARSESRYGAYLADQADAGLQRSLIDMRPLDARLIEVAGRTYVNFSSNDYLALRFHPAVIARAKLWLDAFGAGSGASRLVTGNLEAFSVVEAKIAKLKKKEAALVMASGFQANGAVLQALLDSKVLGAKPLVFADKLNHASMHFGCAAAGVRQQRYRHRDADHLAELLKKTEGEEAPRFILTESVFSMDGDVAPLEEIGALAREYDATLIVDDAHGTGVLGEEGEGLSGSADIVIGTASKALGGFGAYVACSKRVRDYLVNRCSGLIYSTALPPAVLGAMDAALDLLPSQREARTTVARLSRRFREGVHGLEFETGASETQIVPVIVGSAQAANGLSKKLKATGSWATAIRPPTVPKGTARLRFAFTAAHTDEDVDDLLEVLEESGPGSISGRLAAE
ncbi:aminotransferase class I/II-fold pyridoxal phosphate-dependent enzyme [Methyloligella solikamskensis]|uniref:Aminotransferase class I/II-fold pyridoxal phosphate-dependent enzyme n=1 Tax=Methyloligella solikamskensis TaxID=1177756 RepID=A0ABW3JBQ7_9HYPH